MKKAMTSDKRKPKYKNKSTKVGKPGTHALRVWFKPVFQKPYSFFDYGFNPTKPYESEKKRLYRKCYQAVKERIYKVEIVLLGGTATQRKDYRVIETLVGNEGQAKKESNYKIYIVAKDRYKKILEEAKVIHPITIIGDPDGTANNDIVSFFSVINKPPLKGNLKFSQIYRQRDNKVVAHFCANNRMTIKDDEFGREVQGNSQYFKMTNGYDPAEASTYNPVKHKKKTPQPATV